MKRLIAALLLSLTVVVPFDAQAGLFKDIRMQLSKIQAHPGNALPALFEVEDGRRVQDQDMKIIFKLTKSGAFRLHVMTRPTSHIVGSCATFAVWLLDSNQDILRILKPSQFCVGTRDGIGGPKNRDEFLLSAKHEEVPQDVLEKVAGVSIVMGDGHKNVWDLLAHNIDEAKRVVKRVK